MHIAVSVVVEVGHITRPAGRRQPAMKRQSPVPTPMAVARQSGRLHSCGSVDHECRLSRRSDDELDFGGGTIPIPILSDCVRFLYVQSRSAILTRAQESTRSTGEELMVTEPWVSVEDIVKHLGVARDSVYRWIERRGLPAHKIGRHWKFKLSEVDDWVRDGGAEAHDEPTTRAAK